MIKNLVLNIAINCSLHITQYLGSYPKHQFLHIYYASAAALTVFFDQPSYRVNENRGSVQSVLVLSNPSSTDITIKVDDVGITAIG